MRTFDLRLLRGPSLPLLGIVFMGGVVLWLLSEKFLTTFAVYGILSYAALLAVIGFSQLTVISVGEFSLAVGGIGSFTGIVVGYLLVQQDMPVVPAFLVGLGVGVASGFINGILVAKSGVNGFIITLATGGIFAGAALGVTRASPYTGLPEIVNRFGTGRFGFFPYLAVATIVVAASLAALYRWRKVGRMMLAVGGNAEAAELSGLSRARAIVWAHSLSGLLAAAAGIMAMAQLHQGNPSAGTDWLILSFAVPIIGGTVLTGGSVSIGGVLVASVILAMINNGLVLVNVKSIWVTLVQGVLVFVAVVVGRVSTWQAVRVALARAGGWRAVKT